MVRGDYDKVTPLCTTIPQVSPRFNECNHGVRGEDNPDSHLNELVVVIFSINSLPISQYLPFACYPSKSFTSSYIDSSIQVALDLLSATHD